MMKLELRPISSMEKVFGDGPLSAEPLTAATALKGEVFSFQVAGRVISSESGMSRMAKAEVTAICKLPVEVRQVRSVPVEIPCLESDGYLLREEPGLYPDLLTKGENPFLFPSYGWRSFWITVRIPENCRAGKYPVTVRFKEYNWSSMPVEKPDIQDCTFQLEVLPTKPARQTLLDYEWFHADCLAAYYKVETWSREHWRIMGNFFRNMAAHGQNVLLTPLWTPPLDTGIGRERPTTQLLIVRKKNGRYTFDFSRLEQYLELAMECGITHFGMSHAFTQWGVKATPKIVAEVDGREKRIFGWDVPADSPEYRKFLTALMPKLLAFLRKKGLAGKVFFSVSDEPSMYCIKEYAYAAKLMESLLEDFPTLDALSKFDFFKNGLVKHPVPATNHIEPFVGNVRELFTYYCSGQYDRVPNRFIAMPGARTRIMGVLFYCYNVVGFLQWGYNFYYSLHSCYAVDPYRDTTGGRWVPAGDAFVVYPGENGEPEDSLRHELCYESIQDLNALRALEKKIGRDAVIALIHEGLNYRLSMTEYPRSAEWLLALREKVNRYLAAK